jgi:hypothetical protein
MSSLPGPVLALSFLVATALLCGVFVLLVRLLLPPSHPLRRWTAMANLRYHANPGQFFKSLEKVFFGLLILTFVLITLIYS